MREPNYSEYSEDELRFALTHIDSKQHPDRHKTIIDLLRDIEESKLERLHMALSTRYEGGIQEVSLEFRKRIKTSAKYCIFGAFFIALNLSSNFLNQYLAMLGLGIDSWGEVVISAAGMAMIVMAYKSAKCPLCDKYIGGNLWTTNSCRSCGSEFI